MKTSVLFFFLLIKLSGVLNAQETTERRDSYPRLFREARTWFNNSRDFKFKADKFDSLINVEDEWINASDCSLSTRDTLNQISGILMDSAAETRRSITLELRDSLDLLFPDVLTSVTKKPDALEGEIQSKSEKIEDSLEKPLPSINEGLSDRTSNATDKLEELPDVGQPDIGSADLGLPSMDLPRVDFPEVDVPDANLPSLEGVARPGLSIEDPNSSTSLPGGRGLPEVNLPGGSLPVVTEIQKVDSKLDEVDAVLGRGEEIEEGLNELKEGNSNKLDDLEKEAERRAATVGPVASLDKQVSKMTAEQARYEQMLQRYKDEKFIREELQRKTPAIANDRINKYSEPFKQANQKIAKAKGLMGSKALTELLENKRWVIEDKPWYRRLTPGLALEFFNTDHVQTNLAIHLGFQLTGRLNAGVEGVHRLGFSKDYPMWVGSEGLYGFRNYGEFDLVKGIFIHGEWERMYAGGRWVSGKESFAPVTNSVNAGIGKYFRFTKSLKGSTIALYRRELSGHVPEMSKITLRLVLWYDSSRPRSVKLSGKSNDKPRDDE